MNPVFGDWAGFGLEDDIRPALGQAIARGQAVALATIGRAVGGAPFGVGAQMLMTADGASGFLTGGCVEADVALHAAEALQDGEPRELVYGEGGAMDIRLPCGGRIDVRLERIGPDDAAAARLLHLAEARRPALWISDGRERRCLAQGEAAPCGMAIEIAEKTGRAALIGRFLLRRHDPPRRLVVIGQDPIALAMAQAGLSMGWACTLVRPRGPEAAPPIPGLGYRREAVGPALAGLAPDAWTAVVVATHEREDDGEAATAAALSDAGYVGLLGSRRRLPARLSDLRDAGATPVQLDRLKAPVGLDIGAVGPREIAVAVVGEIVQAAHAPAVGRLWPFQATLAA